jgi:predicted GNAT superfamily acetyltransferase
MGAGQAETGRRAGGAAMIVIRTCVGLDELEACVQHQIETWGYDESDVIPRKAFLVAQKIGGQVIGAFDTELPGASAQGGPESLVGFVLALPGVKTGSDGPRAYLHSHMLAVREAYRNRGVGARLKREQRREALARGIRHMEWTFDPLEIKNAYLNIHKLGAIVRDYRENFYGVSSSRLQGGLPTDRLVAEWQLDSPRVQAFLEGHPAVAHAVEERILVPAAISRWKASDVDRDRALAVQQENRRRFQQAFSQGLAVLGFVRDAEGNGVFELGSFTQPELDLHPKDRKTL